MMIGLVIAVVVGVSLILGISSSVDKIVEDSEFTAVGTLTSILPFIFVAVLLIGAVAFMAYESGSRHEDKDVRENKREARDLSIQIPKSDPATKSESIEPPTTFFGES